MEFERMVKTFTVLSIVIMLLSAFAALSFTSVMQAEYNVSGVKPEIARDAVKEYIVKYR